MKTFEKLDVAPSIIRSMKRQSRLSRDATPNSLYVYFAWDHKVKIGKKLGLEKAQEMTAARFGVLDA